MKFKKSQNSFDWLNQQNIPDCFETETHSHPWFIPRKNDLLYISYYSALTVIRKTNRLNPIPATNPLIVQLIRSSSIEANVVEESSGSSKKDLARFYQIAIKSANESKYRLSLIRDIFELKQNKVDSLIKEADEIARTMASSILTLHRQIKSEK